MERCIAKETIPVSNRICVLLYTFGLLFPRDFRAAWFKHCTFICIAHGGWHVSSLGGSAQQYGPDTDSHADCPVSAFCWAFTWIHQVSLKLSHGLSGSLAADATDPTEPGASDARKLSGSTVNEEVAERRFFAVVALEEFITRIKYYMQELGLSDMAVKVNVLWMDSVWSDTDCWLITS